MFAFCHRAGNVIPVLISCLLKIAFGMGVYHRILQVSGQEGNRTRVLTEVWLLGSVVCSFRLTLA